MPPSLRTRPLRGRWEERTEGGNGPASIWDRHFHWDRRWDARVSVSQVAGRGGTPECQG